MSSPRKIAFVWTGFDGRYGKWKDGLWAAMQILEKTFEVRYYDTSRLKDIYDFAPDVVLYWESLSTFASPTDRMGYWEVQSLPYKKALLFAGGTVKEEWMGGFDLFFVESKVNEEEFEALGKPWKRAFGVNTQIFKPEKQPKVFDGVFQATCASWKRPWLGAEALHDKYAVMGRFQPEDPIGFMRVRDQGGLVLPELSAEAVCSMINASYTVVNTSEYWGGGQRSTLEAMACGVMPIVMSDSPKNMEYVLESNFGDIVEPNPEAIKRIVEFRKMNPQPSNLGVQYVQSKYTEQHYATALVEGIESII